MAEDYRLLLVRRRDRHNRYCALNAMNFGYSFSLQQCDLYRRRGRSLFRWDYPGLTIHRREVGVSFLPTTFNIFRELYHSAYATRSRSGSRRIEQLWRAGDGLEHYAEKSMCCIGERCLGRNPPFASKQLLHPAPIQVSSLTAWCIACLTNALFSIITNNYPCPVVRLEI